MAKAKLGNFRTQARNANKHTERGLGMLEKSIKQDGWIGAVTVAADGETFDGSARLEVLADAMPSAEPIVVESDGTRPVVVRRTDIASADDPRAVRLGLGANRIAQVDYAVNPDVLASLAGEVDLSQFWSKDELADILKGMGGNDAEDPGAQVDKAAELQAKWGTALGQLWQAGRHRLLVGDCTVAENVARLMGGEKADAVITDPPYGIDLLAERGKLGNSKPYDPILGDKDTATVRSALEVYLPLAPVQVWWGGNHYADALPPSPCWLVWDKDHHGMTFADAELAWCNSTLPVRVFRHAWSGADRDSEKGAERFHPNQKPIALSEWCIETVAGNAEIIVDPFNGVGFVLMACEKLGRIGRGMELSPAYAAVTLERLAGLGLTPELVG